MISDLFKRFFMVKFCKSEKKSHIRSVQTIYEEEIGRLGIQRRIFFTLSGTNYIILSGCVPPFWFLGCLIRELFESSFNLPENLVGCLNSGTGTPLFCAYKCSISYIMEIINLSTVIPEAVAQQKTLVDNLHASLMRCLHSDDFEAYRQKWAKARALLCDMQGALYFSRKEVCHG